MTEETKKDPLLGDNAPETPDKPNEVEPAKTTEPEQEKPVPEVPVSKNTVAGAVNKKNFTSLKQLLESQPKVSFIIPLIEGETNFDTVQITTNLPNGKPDTYKLTVKKGVLVELPKAIANLLAEKYRIQMTAGEAAKIGGNSKKEEALS